MRCERDALRWCKMILGAAELSAGAETDALTAGVSEFASQFGFGLHVEETIVTYQT